MSDTRAQRPEPVFPETLAVVAGRPGRDSGAPLNAGVVLTSAHVSAGTPGDGDPLYTRYDAPTWHPFEEALAALEGTTTPAVVFGSGMAAIAATLALAGGGRLVVPEHAYQGTLALCDDLAASGTEVTRVDITDTSATLAAARGAALLWLESPTNPLLEVADLPALIDGARGTGTLVAVDNTFLTPLGQQPLLLGADVVVHSVTKYLAGHSDVVLGAAVAEDPDLRARLASHRRVHGAIAGPWETWLALRGMRTLALRVRQSQDSASLLAHRLVDHPAVAEVRYPGLPGDPGNERATAMLQSFGSIVGLRPRGGAQAADAVVDAVRLWVPATSLGGVESTLERRRRFVTESADVPEDLIRLSVGIEAPSDLWADLDRALLASQ